MCLKFQEISYAKSCVLNMAAVLILLYQRKLLTNYQVCILNIRKSFCNSQIVPSIEKHSRYFVGKSCIHVPLLHIHCTVSYLVHLSHCSQKNFKSIAKWKKMASFYCILFRYEILLKVSFMDINCTTMQ